MKILFIFLFISTSLIAQDYDKNWDKVIKLENKGSVKSANEVVGDIYKQAIADKNEVQIIKCFFYTSKYMQTLEEDAQRKIIANLKHEISRVSLASQAILNLVYAKCLSSYVDENRYKLNQRTKTDTLAEDFLSWSVNALENEIATTFKKTLENEVVLQQTLLLNYEAIFYFYSIEKFKTQNLYAFMLKENISYYTSQLNKWENRSSDFNSIKAGLMSNTADFTKMNLDTIKNAFLKKALTLYQQLERIYPTPENQLERLLFCSNYIVKSPNDFLTSLNAIQKSNTDDKLLQKILLEKATVYTELASKKVYPDYNNKAILILDSIIKIANHSNAYKLAVAKKQQIIFKSLSVQLQKYTYPNEFTRAFITYKNVDSIAIYFYKINQKTLAYFEDRSKKRYKNKDSLLTDFLSKNKAISALPRQLVNKKDYFEYTTEVLLPQLQTGSYLVYIQNEGYSISGKAYAFETITVSNFTVLANRKGKKEYYQVLDRKTGKPIEQVKLSTNYSIQKTNHEGVAIVDAETSSNYNEVSLELTKEKDTLYLPHNYLNYESDKENATENFRAKVEFYLDRAIYRPGQIVYYKGVAVQKKQKSSIVPGLLLQLTIENASGEEIKTFTVTTNEFGSFSGEFVLPNAGLTGDFKIIASEPDSLESDPLYDKKEDEHPFWDNVEFDDSEIEFRVEEYKRPKFEVIFESNKDSYQLNHKITVSGKAKAFAGNLISDAKVTYMITRHTTYYKGHYYDRAPETLEAGTTKTDALGKFYIAFIAKPQEGSNKENFPVFTYTITTNVTDINGETHSEETIIKVGFHALAVRAIVPPLLETKNKDTIQLITTNLNGEFIAAKGELKFYFIRASESKFKPRLWEKPEIESISPTEFNTLFPFEQNEKKISEEDKGTLVYSEKVNTKQTKAFAMDFISAYKSGYYKVVFSAVDTFNNSIENSSSFEIKQSNDTNSDKLFSIEQLNENPQKDGFVTLKLSSILPELYIFSTVNHSNKKYSEQRIILKNGQAIVNLPLEKAFTNKVEIGLECIFDNSLFHEELEVKLNREQLPLQFEVESFRNKIEPGSKEHWSFRLLSQSTSVKAEVLASMYDSSLDQFVTANWSSLAFAEHYYNDVFKRTDLGFGTINSELHYLNHYFPRPELYSEYSKLMWFGFNFGIATDYYALRDYKNELSQKQNKPLDAKLISGIVSDAAGPVEAAIVRVKGTDRAVITDNEGYYEIEAAMGEELQFSFVDLTTEIIKVTSKTIDVTLKGTSGRLHEVVVTALGIKRKKKALGYATREVKAEFFDLNAKTAGVMIRGAASLQTNNKPLIIIDGVASNESMFTQLTESDIISANILKGDAATAIYGSKAVDGVILITTKRGVQELAQVKPRTNFSETAFFLPNLITDSKGKISFSFTSPEALTAWKLRLLAHNKDAVSGYLEESIITQKDVMVMPNFPRFFREKDSITINTKIANMTNNAQTGIANLLLYDALTMEAIDANALNINSIRNYTIPAFGNTTVSWAIYIPEGLQGIQYKVLAKSGNFSDGEENSIPVLTNNLLVTESIPIWVTGNSKKEYTLENLKSNTSTTLSNHQLTVEYTSNPTWLAIQCLPYLMEYEHECAEQTFARFYANALGSELINSNPKIAKVFEDWKIKGKLKSELAQNEALKSILLSETPWLNDAKTEEEKKNALALLFDLAAMKNALEANFEKLKQKQQPSGGFAWFDGGHENEYITRHILAGLGHLNQLNVKIISKEKRSEISIKGITFIDAKFLEENKKRINYKKEEGKLVWMNPYVELHYLYTRSFYLKEAPLSENLKTIIKSDLNVLKESWLNYNLYEKAMVALVLYRFNERATAKKILENLKETSSTNEDWGMYWIANQAGWYWYQAPIETQALLIEAFSEIDNDTKSVDAMKVWLLKNKQCKNWPTTKATTEAVYALLMQGSDWLSVKDNTIINIGDRKITSQKLAENEKEAETGYLKLTWKKDEIKKEMGSVTVENKSKVPGFGGIYWQYFEDLDNIKANAGNSLSVSKELYLKQNTNTGMELHRITAGKLLKIGDLVTVRLLITAKEDMEFVHLKDMRASCFEPTAVLSGYTAKDGLRFYRSTKDAATHFFFDNINKGTYVLEYDTRVNNTGNFSNGITTIGSMYAPEFTSHTKGIRVKVTNP